MTRRIIRFLDRKPLTPRQKAQRKYRASAKGLAATARGRAKRKQDPKYLTALRARADAWKKAHPTECRVYNRIYLATRRRLRREQAAAA